MANTSARTLRLLSLLERDRAVDVKEVRSQQRGGASAQEGTPGRVTVHRWRDAMSTQDHADGGGRDPAQLALGAYHSPAPVLPRQPPRARRCRAPGPWPRRPAFSSRRAVT